MSRQGGLGRGLASLIPPKKQDQSQPLKQDRDYFSAQIMEEKAGIPQKKTFSQSPKADLTSQKEASVKINKEKAVVAQDDSVVKEISVANITANPYQPRKHFDVDKLQELADSIKVHGLIQPLIVSVKAAGLYELIAGERRLQAVKMLGLQKVPVIVRKVNDQEKLELALIENIQRHDLNVIEEARSFKQLHEKFALTQMEISERVGKSRSAVANTLRLLSLPMDIQRTLQEGKITEGHARSILSIENPEKQRAMLDAIVRGNLSVRQTEEKAKDVMMGKNNRSRLFGTDPELSAYEQQISAALGTKVKIKKGTHGGQIVIEYYSSEELSGLVEKLSSF